MVLDIRRPLATGWIRGGKASFPLPMSASAVIKTFGGGFVYMDGGYGSIATDGTTALAGYVEGGDQTCIATDGSTVLNCIYDVTAVFRVPLIYDNSTYTVNYADTLLGALYDIITISGIQYINLTTQTEGTIVVVGGKAATSTTVYDGFVDVRLNPETMQ